MQFSDADIWRCLCVKMSRFSSFCWDGADEGEYGLWPYSILHTADWIWLGLSRHRWLVKNILLSEWGKSWEHHEIFGYSFFRQTPITNLEMCIGSGCILHFDVGSLFCACSKGCIWRSMGWLPFLNAKTDTAETFTFSFASNLMWPCKLVAPKMHHSSQQQSPRCFCPPSAVNPTLNHPKFGFIIGCTSIWYNLEGP